VKSAFDAALHTLQSLGATLVDIELPHARYAIPVYYLVCTAELSSNLARYDGVRFGFRAASARGQTPADYLATLHPQVLAGTKAMRAGLLVSSSLLYWVLFRRARPRFVDHVVLALNLGCFALTVGIVVNAISGVVGNTAPTLLIGLPLSAGYAVVAARRVYGQRLRSTIWKVLLIYVLTLVAASTTLIGILGLVIALN
jgi:hypothetical protein